MILLINIVFIFEISIWIIFISVTLLTGEILPIGNLRINSITELRRLAGIKSVGDADCPTLLDIEMCNPNNSDASKPKFGVKCKLFELDPCQNVAKVSWKQKIIILPPVILHLLLLNVYYITKSNFR